MNCSLNLYAVKTHSCDAITQKESHIVGED